MPETSLKGETKKDLVNLDVKVLVLVEGLMVEDTGEEEAEEAEQEEER